MNKLFFSASAFFIFLPNHFEYFSFLIFSLLLLFFYTSSGLAFRSLIFVSCSFVVMELARIFLFGHVDFNFYKMLLLVFIIYCVRLGADKGMFAFYDFVFFIVKFFTFFSLIVVVAQIINKDFFIWKLWAENYGQYDNFYNGFRPFGTTGNPTHSSYLTLLCLAVVLLYKFRFFYVIILFSLLCIYINKVSLLVGMVMIALYYLFFQKGGLYSKIVIFSGLLVFSFFVVNELIAPYFERWEEAGYENVHTITHRLGVLDSVFGGQSGVLGILLGYLDVYSSVSKKAFDSNVLFIISRFGVFGFLLIYFVIFLKFCKNKTGFVFLILVCIPSITMIAFYNTQYIFFSMVAFLCIGAGGVEGKVKEKVCGGFYKKPDADSFHGRGKAELC